MERATFGLRVSLLGKETDARWAPFRMRYFAVGFWAVYFCGLLLLTRVLASKRLLVSIMELGDGNDVMPKYMYLNELDGLGLDRLLSSGGRDCG